MKAKIRKTFNLTFRKQIICAAIFVLMSPITSSSSDFLDKVQGQTKSASDILSNTITTGADSVSTIFSSAVTGLDKIGSNASKEAGAVFDNFMKDFDKSRSIFNDAGFHLKTATIYASIPPSINVTFTNGTLRASEKYDNLKAELAGKPIMSALFATLVSFSEINSGRYAVTQTTIKIGVPPSAWGVIPLDHK